MKVREDKILHPDGKEGIYSVVDIAPGIFTIALTEKNEIYLVKQLRYTTGINSWELPGGGQKKGETYLETAKRELKEEAGLIAKEWFHVGRSQALNGSSSQIDQVFIARGLKKVGGKYDRKEGISRVNKFPVPKIVKMIRNGEISDGQAITHLTMALLYLGYAFEK
ncbi:MAG: NUDIX domain-containing protein [Patescibacteria group bacterium]